MSSYTVETAPSPAVVEPPFTSNENLDDIFGSDEEVEAGERGIEEWSDIPRIKEKHETEGYRDGVTKGKAETVQKGFDEGYNLGAVLGLRIGKVLGLLEGIAAAIRRVEGQGAESEWESNREKAEGLLKEATEELKTQNVFAKEWWGEDGIWRFEVEGEKEGKEILLPDVAAAHPLVRKWEMLVQAEVERWGLNLEIMDHEYEKTAVKEPVHERDEKIQTAPGSAKELSW
ncbi:essential protein-like protein Yae1 [Bisporella sp. PMI_857]|nr:essential protein-like protein Yae1 [Bisporella sp. PMI_857]